jgi:hypothetical protein
MVNDLTSLNTPYVKDFIIKIMGSTDTLET